MMNKQIRTYVVVMSFTVVSMGCAGVPDAVRETMIATTRTAESVESVVSEVESYVMPIMVALLALLTALGEWVRRLHRDVKVVKKNGGSSGSSK
tara:strand:- start:161 stop:442 length:282 start_codon:yes stop_codon:yes gene_type:complete